jgi:hypothetical protein
MRINELLARTRKVLDVQPAPVQRQARINQVVANIAASEQDQPATELDKVMAMQQYADMKKQANQNYANNLQRQLASCATKQRTKR